MAALALALTAACQPEIVPEPYRPTSAHDAYRRSLVETGLDTTALGRDWQSVADAALRAPIDVIAPYRETVYVDEAAAFAAGYRFSVKRGQRTEIQLALQPASDWRVYLDLFRVPEEPGEPPVHVASGAEGDLRLAFEPRRDGRYLLRLQSELLRGGSCTVAIRSVASLEFPVDGHDTGSIGSTFGDPREGGRREHHGVDIFAARHTEVLATSRARVRRVDDWKLGGRVIWLEDPERNLRLYFAHLQTQDVEEGAWVEAGERIGTVGNSGNARTTPPHLHFGVYVRGEGPIDPDPFLRQPLREPSEVRVPLEHLGRWLRTRDHDVPLLPNPVGDDPMHVLKRHTAVRVTGGSNRRYRVVLPNGVVGYLSARETEPVGEAIDTLTLKAAAPVLDAPGSASAVIEEFASGTRLEVLARYGEFVFVENRLPRPAWLRAESPPQSATAP